MFDPDAFVDACVTALAESEPRLAIKDVLERACAEPGALADALPPDQAGITRLHVSPDLTVLKVVWAPRMHLWPHDHRMWATIGMYTGGEDNTFYRRAPGGLTESGGRSLGVGDSVLLGDDTIHAVTNPTTEFAGALHIYGGDFFATPRSEWNEATLEEQPYNVERTLRHFEEENARFAHGQA